MGDNRRAKVARLPARRAPRLAIALALSLISSAAAAQSVPRTVLPSILPPGQGRPVPELPPAPNFDFSIETPRRSPVPRAVEELSFEVKDIRIVGATVYRPEELRPLFAALIDQQVHLADIIAVSEKIESKYRADGYVLTRAFVPPQSVSAGVFQINVVEGYVEAVSVEGGDDSTRERVRTILQPVTASRPLQVKTIESALLRANQLPGTGASGLLRPSPTQPGASDLVVTVTGAPLSVVLSVDNRGTHLTDRWTEEADVAMRLDHGDQILLMAQTAPHWGDRHELSARIVHPIGTDGMTVSASALVANSQPVANSGGTSLQLLTNSKAFGARASYPLLVTRENVLAADAGLTFQSSRVGGNFRSRDTWRVIDWALAYQNTGFLDGVSSASLDLAHGLSIFGAMNSTSNEARSGGQPDFTKVTTVLRRIQPLWGSFSAAVLGTGQYSFNTLPLGEEIAFGNTSGFGGATASVGRGYDPASLTGDSGAGASFELRYDHNEPAPFVSQAQYYAFYDAARIWYHKSAPPDNDTLQSAGVGIRVSLVHDIAASVEIAHAFVPLPTNDAHSDGRYDRDTRVMLNAAVRF